MLFSNSGQCFRFILKAVFTRYASFSHMEQALRFVAMQHAVSHAVRSHGVYLGTRQFSTDVPFELTVFMTGEFAHMQGNVNYLNSLSAVVTVDASTSYNNEMGALEAVEFEC
jgi:hypothetical protein